MDTWTVPIKVRLMNGTASYPRQIDDYLLSGEGSVTQIFKENERIAGCRPQTVENHKAPEALARIHCDKWSVVLEPLVQGVTVEAPFFSKRTQALSSSPVNVSLQPYYPGKTYVFLRPEDTVKFPDQHLVVDIMFAEDSKSESYSVSKAFESAEDYDLKSEVQVKSSNVEPVTGIGAKENDDATDNEDEIDLEQAVGTHYAQAPGVADTTPVTSRRYEITIKETPKHDNSAVTDEGEPYSTAPDKINDDGVATIAEDDQDPVAGAESPSVIVQRSRTETSQVSAKPIDTVDGTPSDTDGADEPCFDNAKKVSVTYSKREVRRRTPDTREKRGQPLDTLDLLDTDSLVVPDGMNFDEAEGGLDVEVEQIIAPTSDPMNDHEVAAEAAKRSLSQGSIKRKAFSQEAEDEQDAAIASKKTKLDEASATIETPDEDEESEAEGPPKEEPDLKIAKDRLKRPNRRQTQEESEEEIAVAAKKFSPAVVIKPHRLSGTPSSSATVSSLAGKVPKILLSSESTVQKNAPLKKWLKKMGAAIIDNIPSRGTHFVCVVTKEHSLKSAKVLQSLAMGKLIVTDDWLTDSKEADELLDPAEFVHKALEANITHDRSRIFSGKYLFFTTPLVSKYKDGWNDIQELAKEAGAIEVDKVPFNKETYLQDHENVVFFGSGKTDNDASRLIKEHGCTVYSKELFTHSIITGELELGGDEYKLTCSAPLKKSRRS